MLRIEPSGTSEPSARLRDYFAHAVGLSWTLLADAQGQRRLLVQRSSSQGRATHWQIRQFVIGQGGLLRALDDTHFEATATTFAETERYRSDGGPNLHRQPIVLPAQLTLGNAEQPFPGTAASVTLTYAGKVSLSLGDREQTAHACCLVASEGDAKRCQWLLAGFGEGAIGAEAGEFQRWLVAGATETGQQLFGGVAAQRTRNWDWDALPKLGAGDERTAPRRSLF